MSFMQTAALKAGRIFGDPAAHEYVYMPAGELGAEEPLCVYETDAKRATMSRSTKPSASSACGASAPRAIRVSAKALADTNHCNKSVRFCYSDV